MNIHWMKKSPKIFGPSHPRRKSPCYVIVVGVASRLSIHVRSATASQTVRPRSKSHLLRGPTAPHKTPLKWGRGERGYTQGGSNRGPRTCATYIHNARPISTRAESWPKLSCFGLSPLFWQFGILRRSHPWICARILTAGRVFDAWAFDVWVGDVRFFSVVRFDGSRCDG